MDAWMDDRIVLRKETKRLENFLPLACYFLSVTSVSYFGIIITFALFSIQNGSKYHYHTSFFIGFTLFFVIGQCFGKFTRTMVRWTIFMVYRRTSVLFSYSGLFIQFSLRVNRRYVYVLHIMRPK